MATTDSEVLEVQHQLLADESGQACAGVPTEAPSTTIQQRGQVPPDNYSFLAWFSCLCCCWPVGAFAISASHDVDYRWARGDLDGARQASRRAKTISVVAIAVGVLCGTWYFILLVMSDDKTASMHH